MSVNRTQLICNETFEVFVVLLLEPRQVLIVNIWLQLVVFRFSIAEFWKTKLNSVSYVITLTWRGTLRHAWRKELRKVFLNFFSLFFSRQCVSFWFGSLVTVFCDLQLPTSIEGWPNLARRMNSAIHFCVRQYDHVWRILNHQITDFLT